MLNLIKSYTGLIYRNCTQDLHRGLAHRNYTEGLNTQLESVLNILMKDWSTIEIAKPVFEEVESTTKLHTWPLIIHVGKPWMLTASHSLAICTPLL